ncbi:unnamed protein product [Rhizophagus irregularis]|uniref:FAR1 domain-containing protein n=1 Tax=Rhizophagus irregularis TaxID=588596 RepID=A0A915YUG2_9GLOM|nr:unnamed protein product [Rhizophagus irregularis]
MIKVQEYASFYNFQIRKEKVKRDKNNNIRKGTIVCSRAGIARQKDENINSRDRQSQRCDCPFLIRASLNSQTGVWHILAMKLDHNHEMVNPEHKKFLHNESRILRIVLKFIIMPVVAYQQLDLSLNKNTKD